MPRPKQKKQERTITGPLEYAQSIDSVSDYSRLDHMKDWPGCPDLDTFRAASIARWAMLDELAPVKDLREYHGSENYRVGLMDERHAAEASFRLQMLHQMNPEQIKLAETLHDLFQTGRYSHAVQETIHAQGELSELKEHLLKFQLALAGESPRTIGGWIESSAKVHIPGKAAVCFTRLSRDPNWMGLDETLPHVRGCNCVILRSNKHHPDPALFIAMSPGPHSDIPREAIKPKPAANAQRDALRSILEYHGAAEIVEVTLGEQWQAQYPGTLQRTLGA